MFSKDKSKGPITARFAVGTALAVGAAAAAGGVVVERVEKPAAPMTATATPNVLPGDPNVPASQDPLSPGQPEAERPQAGLSPEVEEHGQVETGDVFDTSPTFGPLQTLNAPVGAETGAVSELTGPGTPQSPAGYDPGTPKG
jgi:hypothetical protein